MEYQITHTTAYEYPQSVSLCHNIAKLSLRNTTGQWCKSSVVQITPKPGIISEYEDFFGNKVTYFAIQQEHEALTVTVKSQVEKTAGKNPTFNFFSATSWEEAKGQLLEPGIDNFNARQYVAETPFTQKTKEISAYASLSFIPGRSIFEAAQDLMQRIFHDFEFNPRFTTIATPLSEVMKLRKGVCQDFAHLAVACVRSVGLAARYVSGYLETVAPPGKEKLTGVDASHAWFSVYVPGAGWIDFDPTNNIMPSLRHLCIGWGRDYADVTPLKGVILSSGDHKLKVSVDVKRMS